MVISARWMKVRIEVLAILLLHLFRNRPRRAFPDIANLPARAIPEVAGIGMDDLALAEH